jgi:hypothetical protein
MQWSGTWKKVDGGAPLAFSFRETNDALNGFDGSIHCATKTVYKSSDFTFRNTLALTARHGQMSKFSLDSSADATEGDQQSCSIDLSQLHRAPSDSGVLLQTRTGKLGPDQHQCSIRIVGNQDFLFVAIGDADEDGNDCHGDTDMMYCSARGSWTDLVVERKTQTCRAVQ